jgi:hypothetical protein
MSFETEMNMEKNWNITLMNNIVTAPNNMSFSEANRSPNLFLPIFLKSKISLDSHLTGKE